MVRADDQTAGIRILSGSIKGPLHPFSERRGSRTQAKTPKEEEHVHGAPGDMGEMGGMDM